MDDKLSLPSITGVDVELDVAGPGARSYAFVIDWHLRALLSAAWLIAGSALYAGAVTLIGPDEPGFTGYAFAILLPASAIYFLYHPVLEALMRGRTPGKRIAGIRIVKNDGTTPDAGAIVIRNVFRLVDSLPALYAVGLATTMLTRRWVRIGDMAAGTLLVYDQTQRAEAGLGRDVPASPRLGLAQSEIVRDLLDRWSELGPEARTRLARRIVAPHAPDVAAAANDLELRAQLEQLLD